jgi:uncharacterized protein
MLTNTMPLRRWATALMLALSLLVSGAATTPSNAQEIPPEELALARQYIDLVNTANLFRGVMLKVAINSFKALQAGHADIQLEIQGAVDRTLQSYTGQESSLLDQLARVYATVFSLEELQEIVAFYESPTGKKLAAAATELAGTTDDVLKVYENNLSSEFVAKVRADLKAKGVNI